MHNLIYGRRPVEEALRSGAEITAVIFQEHVRGENVQEIRALAERRKVPVRIQPANYFDKLFPDLNHQGVMAELVSREFQYAEPEEMLELAARRNEKPALGILDQITDPHNLGAIIRSAVAAGLHGLIIPKHHSAEVTATVMKTSAGAALFCKIAVVTNIVHTMDWLKKQDLWIYGTSLASVKSLYETDLTGGTAMVIGSEGKGMRRLVEEHCDFLVSIPMHGPVQSLNASVAAGIMFFELRRQRNRQ